jgi:hypothetical protein
MLWIFWFVWSLKSNMATNTRSVWIKVEYRRPFSGVPSATTLSFRRPTSATTFNFFRTTLSCNPVWTTLNFWTTPSFFRTTPSCNPGCDPVQLCNPPELFRNPPSCKPVICYKYIGYLCTRLPYLYVRSKLLQIAANY